MEQTLPPLVSDEQMETEANEWREGERGLRYARDHYLKPSQAIGEPVALDDRTFIALFAKVKCEFCEEGKDEGRTCATCHGLGMRDPDLYELRSRMRNLYRSPISPEARDRAISALEAIKRGRMDKSFINEDAPCGVLTFGDVRNIDQALSALRGETKQTEESQYCDCVKPDWDGPDNNGHCIHCGRGHNPLPFKE